jgi:hypothetical protein
MALIYCKLGGCLSIRAFRTSESADFSEVGVRKFRTLKTLRTRTQRVCLFTHLCSKEVNISQKNSESESDEMAGSEKLYTPDTAPAPQ